MTTFMTFHQRNSHGARKPNRAHVVANRAMLITAGGVNSACEECLNKKNHPSKMHPAVCGTLIIIMVLYVYGVLSIFSLATT